MTKNRIIEAEIKHGKWLLENDPVMQCGWGTPAGQLRAIRRVQLIAQGVKLSPGQKVLEICCGTGLFTEIFAKYGAHILAVYLSPELLAAARQRNLPTEQVEFLNITFEECEKLGPFDAIIGSSILHHLNCTNSLVKIYQLLKPGSTMCFCEPNMLNPQIFFSLCFRRLFPYISQDEMAYFKNKLFSLLKNSGYSDIVITPFDWLHSRTPQKLIVLVKKADKFVENLPVVNEFAGSLRITAKRPE